MPCVTGTTCLTPGIVSAAVASNCPSVALSVGACSIVANSMPGTRTSAPYAALPVTIAGPSTRLTGVPSNRNAATSFNAGDLGIGSGRRGGCQLSVRLPASARRVCDDPSPRLARARVDVPRARGRGHEHLARGGAGDPQRAELRRAAAAAARVELDAGESSAGRRLLDADARPVDVELLGDHHRQQRAHALAHLELGRPERHAIVRRDPQVRVRLERRRRGLLERLRHAEGEREAGDRGGRLEEFAAGRLGGRHRVLEIVAARCTARRRRVYVPHRQTCVLNVSSICASVGAGAVLRSAAASMIMPG